DLLQAMESSSNPYFSLLASDCIEHPDDLSRAAKEFCYGARTEIDLLAEIPGKVPADLSYNRNGLYAMAIGQHTLTVTPLQTAVMLSAVANGGKIIKPRIVHLTASDSEVSFYPTVVRREVFLPDVIKGILLEGMYRVVHRTQVAIG